MKKIKKLLAGLLSLAMVSSMIPMTMVSAALTTPAREGYQFFETFDGDTVPTAFTMKSNTHWTQSIEDGAMKFTWNSDTTEGASTDLLSINVGSADRSTNAVEYGFRVKMSNVKSNITKLMNMNRGAGDARWKFGPVYVYSTEDGKLMAGAKNWMGDWAIPPGGMEAKGSVDYGTDFVNVKVYIDWFTSETRVSYSTDNGANWSDVVYHKATSKVNDGTSRTKYYTNGSNQKIAYLDLTINDTDAVTEKATNTEHTETIWIDDVYVKNVDVPKYTITYNTHGGSTVSSKLLPLADTTVTLPAAPTKDGGDFTGWYSDEACTQKVADASTKVNLADIPFVTNSIGGKDVTLYAGWQGGSAVSFSGTDTTIATMTVPAGEGIAAADLPYLANENGKTFVGWYTDEALENPYMGEVITGETTLYAKWDENYLLNWNFDGYSNNKILNVSTDRWTSAVVDGKMQFSYDLSKGTAAGVIGGGNNGVSNGQGVAYVQGTDYEVSYEVDFTNAKSLKGNFVPVYAAGSRMDWSTGRYFEFKTGTVVYQPGSANGVAGSTSAPSINLSNITGPIKVTEKYDTYPEKKSVTYATGKTITAIASATATLTWDGGSAETSWYVIPAGSAGVIPTEFKGIRLIDSTSTTEGTGSFTLDNVYVKELDNFVIPMQTISYETNGGSAVSTSSYGMSLTTLTLPTTTKEGGDFTGWYSSADLTAESRIGDAGDAVAMADLPFVVDETTGDKTITLYAGWQSGSAVSFTGTTAEIADITVPEGSGIAADELPSPANEDGKTFVGWYTDESLETPYMGEVITENTTLYAKWDADHIFNWNFDEYTFPSQLRVVAGNERWSAKLEDGKLVYTLDATKGTEGSGYTIWRGDRLGIAVEEGKNYETNYTVDLRNNTSHLTFAPFVLGTTSYTNQQYGIFSFIDTGSEIDIATSQRVTAVQGDNVAFNAAGATLGFTAIDKSTIASPINVKTYYMTYTENKTVIVDRTTEFDASGEAKSIISYTNTDGNEVVYNVYWYMGGKIGNYTKPNVFEYTTASESSAVVSEDVTSSFTLDNVYIREVPSFTVNFVNGEETSQIVTDKGVVSVTLPEEPTAGDGEVFLGWYADEACTKLVAAAGETTVANVSLYDDDNDTVVTLYAGWKVGYRIDFVNGDTNVKTILVGDDGTFDTSEIPFLANEDGKTFIGWFDENDAPLTADAVTESKVYTAKFTSDYSLWWDFEQPVYNEILGVNNDRWTSDVVDGKMVFSYDLAYDMASENVIAGQSNRQGTTFEQGKTYELSYEVDFTNAKNIAGTFAPVYLVPGTRYDWSASRQFNLSGSGSATYIAGVNGTLNSSGSVTIDLNKADGAIKVAEIYETYADVAEDDSAIADARAVLVWTENGVQKSAEVSWTIIKAGSGKLVPTGFNGIKFLDTTVSSEGTGYITLDNVYVGTPKNVTLSFDANGGEEITETVTKFGAFVETNLPTPTTDSGLYFGGWYKNYENGVYTDKVEGSVYVDEDTTLVARWVDAPKAEIVALPNGGANVARDTSITIKFDSEMSTDTLTSANIQLWKNGVKLAGSSYSLTISSDPATTNTIVTLKPNRDLDYASEYTVKVTTGVANFGGTMKEEVSASFTTTTLKFNILNAALKVGTTDIGNEVSKASNQTATITFNLSEAN